MSEIFNKSVLWMPFSESVGTSYTAVKNLIPSGATITTLRGTHTTVSAGQSKYYTGSAFFGDTSAPETGAITGLTFAGEYTVEFWAYVPEASAKSEYAPFLNFMDYTSNANRYGFYLGTPGTPDPNGYPLVRAFSDTNGHRLSATVFDASYCDRWVHFAFVGESVSGGFQVKLYLDGILKETGPVLAAPTFTNRCVFNGLRAASTNRFGIGHYLNDVRVTIANKNYTANFTPPTRLAARISGVVTDENSNPALTDVLLIRRGQTSGVKQTTDPTTGSFEFIDLPSGVEYQRIALDNTDDFNDVIDRVIAL